MTASLTVLTNTPIPHRWYGRSPDQEIVFTAMEAAHIRAILCVTTQYVDPGAVISPDTAPSTNAPVTPSVAYYVVPSGKPARDPTSGLPNGTAVFAAGVAIDPTAPAGASFQSPKLASTTVAIGAGASLVCIAAGDFSMLAGTATINLGV